MCKPQVQEKKKKVFKYNISYTLVLYLIRPLLIDSSKVPTSKVTDVMGSLVLWLQCPLEQETVFCC